MKPSASLATLLLLAVLPPVDYSGAQTAPLPPASVASIGTCRLANGDSLPGCQLSYRVFGALNAERSNAVLLPTWFNGTAGAWRPFLGADGYVDTTVFAAIAVDAFGSGRSSSPSDSVWQGKTFPAVTIGDMVSAQRALLAQLGVQRLYAVVGISMGGMQAFEWALAYPEMVPRIVSIVGSPQLSTYDRVQWSAMLHSITTELAAGVPRDSALQQLARIFTLIATTPEAVNDTPPDSSEARVRALARSLGQRPLENMALQLRAMIAHDVSRTADGDLTAAARRTKAKVLVIGSHDDHAVTPHSALAFARAAGADTLLLPCACGHQVFASERARIGAAIRTFLAK